MSARRPPQSSASLLTCLLLICGSAAAIAQERLSIVPVPAHLTQHTGDLSLESGLSVVFEGYTEPRMDRARDRFLITLDREMGVLPVPAPPTDRPKLVVRTEGPSAPVQEPGEDESYCLQITPSGALLTAPNPLGVLHGFQTFLQLVRSTPAGFSAPAATIDDKPRFPWRGLLIDAARHFMPLEVIRQNLDGMEAVKMNVFHWHLSDDQGFRVESKTYPLLQQMGSDGLFYTQDQVRDVISYARDRGIRVIPEFDIPGHTTSWFVGYPQLASGPGPYSIERHWSIFDAAMDPTRESTYQFLDRFLGEMTALFPDKYFHIGGDECNGKEWNANAQVVAFMQTRHMTGTAALQAYFTRRVEEIVSKYQKTTIGWDEVLQTDTPHDFVVQSWRGQKALAGAAKNGYRGLLSAGYYLDLNWSAEEHYAVDPLRSDGEPLSAREAEHILGGEATMWTEYITPENINNRIWPRTAAIAERLWSPMETNDVESMYSRIARLMPTLAYHGLDVEGARTEMLKRLGSDVDTDSLQVLASVVQPPKNYVREKLRSYDVFTPLNRLVDTVPAESEKARCFNKTAERIAAGRATHAQWSAAIQSLELWRNNDAQLQPLLQRSTLTIELVPVSHDLSQAATIGIDALDHLRRGVPIHAAERDQWLSQLTQFEKPEAVLVNATIPGIKLLVQAVEVY